MHGFGKKLAIFPSFYFREKRPGKCVSRYSKSKNAFLHYKNKKLKKRKNFIFFQKLAIFSSFCFRQNRRGKCFTIF